MKCRYAYAVHKQDLEGMDTHLEAMHGWLGSMTVCCTPMVRFGKWQIDFHRPGAGDPEINIDQSKNLLEVDRGNDLLAALCISYAFDKALCQPLVTIVGYQEKEHMDDDDDSLESFDPERLGRAIDPDPVSYPALPPPASEDEYEEEDTFEPAGYLGYEEETEAEGGYGRSDEKGDIAQGFLEAEELSHGRESSAFAGYIEHEDPSDPSESAEKRSFGGGEGSDRGLMNAQDDDSEGIEDRGIRPGEEMSDGTCTSDVADDTDAFHDEH